MLESILHNSSRIPEHPHGQQHYNPYSSYEIAKDILALFGLMGMLLTALLFYQGYTTTKRHGDEFINLMTDFLRQAVNQDVATALLLKKPLDPDVSLMQATQAIEQYTQKNTLLQISAHFAFKTPIEEKNTQDAMTALLLPMLDNRETLLAVFMLTEPIMITTLLRDHADFAFFLPYRIVMYQDTTGQIWLATLKMDLLIHGTPQLSAEHKAELLKLQDSLMRIMSAGASGVS